MEETLQENDEPIEFIINIDNRNIRVGELNNLETLVKYLTYNFMCVKIFIVRPR